MLIITYTDNGPYYPVSRERFHVHTCKDLMHRVRVEMEEFVHYIGVFEENTGKCRGIWWLDYDVEYGEGECYDQQYAVGHSYVLERDSSRYDYRSALEKLLNE